MISLLAAEILQAITANNLYLIDSNEKPYSHSQLDADYTLFLCLH